MREWVCKFPLAAGSGRSRSRRAAVALAAAAATARAVVAGRRSRRRSRRRRRRRRRNRRRKDRKKKKKKKTKKKKKKTRKKKKKKKGKPKKRKPKKRKTKKSKNNCRRKARILQWGLSGLAMAVRGRQRGRRGRQTVWKVSGDADREEWWWIWNSCHSMARPRWRAAQKVSFIAFKLTFRNEIILRRKGLFETKVSAWQPGSLLFQPKTNVL